MRLALITLLALAAVSCSAQTPTADPKSSATTHAGPTIVLMGKSLTYNGKPLHFNTPIAAWQEVLGPSTKCDGDDGKTFTRLHCWNNLGLSAETSYEHYGQVKNLYIFLNQRPKPEGYDIPNIGPDGKPVTLLDSYHAHLFTGHLELDDATVDRTSTVLKITRHNGYTYHCIRALRDCFVGPSTWKYELSFGTDDDLERGVIYDLTIGDMSL